MVNTAQQLGGAIGTAVFSSLAATAVGDSVAAHAGSASEAATLADATLAGDHLVFWVASAVFLGSAVVAGLMFRGGPLPTGPDAEPFLAR
jgi:hypothetical protein